MILFRVGVWVGTLVTLLAVCPPARGQLTRLNVSYTGESPTQLPAFIAKETGIFAKNGLDVQLVRTTSTVSVMGLLSGDLAILQVAGPAVLSSALKGADAVFVAGGAVTLDYWFMSAKAIKTPVQLKNGTVGSSDLSGASFIASQFAIRKLGLNPIKEVAIIRAGGTSDRLVGLRTGRLQATLLSSHPLALLHSEKASSSMIIVPPVCRFSITEWRPPASSSGRTLTWFEDTSNPRWKLFMFLKAIGKHRLKWSGSI